MPLLDAAVDSLSRWNMKYCLTGILLVLSLMQTVFHRDRFGTDNGFSLSTVIIEAVCLIAIFAGMSLSLQAVKAVRLLAPLTFSVYLIHLHRLFLKFVIMDRFKGFIYFSSVNIVLAVIIATTVIYLFCSVCDMVRAKLFCLLRIDYISELAEKFLGRTVKRLWARMELLMFSASEKNLQEAGQN